MHRLASTVVALLLLSLPTAASADPLPFTVVARTGQSAPGVAGGTFANTLGFNPRIGSAGHVAFEAFMNGVPLTSDVAFWVGLPGSLQVALREDSTATGGPNFFSGSANLGVDSSGTLSMWAQLNNVGLNENQILYSFLPNGNGGNTIVAREGHTAVPGYAGAKWAAIGSGHASNENGAVAFIGTATGGDATLANDQGLWAGTPGNIQLVAREGMAAVGASGTATVFSTTSGQPIYGKAINASGQVAFGASLSGPGIGAGTGNDRAIYVWSPGGGGSLALAVQIGNVAPDTTPTTVFSVIDDVPSFNNAGQVAFRGIVADDDLDPNNHYGVWAGAPGDVRLIYRANDFTPIPGVQFRTSTPYPRIGNGGDVAFKTVIVGAAAGVNSSNNEVLWLSTGDGIELVARKGSPAPGTSAGVNFSAIDDSFTVNGLGQVAFTGTLTGAGVVPANDRGLWAGVPGNVQLIAREGAVIDLDPTAGELLKTILSINFASGYTGSINDSASAGLNDAGQLVWRAQFTDFTTAILLTTLPAEVAEDSADFDEDGDVDGADFLTWQRGVGTLAGATLADGNANATEDDDVDADDLAVWESQFGASAPAAAPVPEPATALLALLALAAASWRHASRFRLTVLNS